MTTLDRLFWNYECTSCKYLQNVYILWCLTWNKTKKLKQTLESAQFKLEISFKLFGTVTQLYLYKEMNERYLQDNSDFKNTQLGINPGPVQSHILTNMLLIVSYNKILDCDWFSAQLLDTQLARNHVGVRFELFVIGYL